LAINSSVVPLVSVADRRALVRLNRPREHNRLEPADLTVLRETFNRVDMDPSVRALVLTGTGESISSGFHIGAPADRLAGRTRSETCSSAWSIGSRRGAPDSASSIMRATSGDVTGLGVAAAKKLLLTAQPIDASRDAADRRSRRGCRGGLSDEPHRGACSNSGGQCAVRRRCSETRHQ
jgi:hypothetical protein